MGASPIPGAGGGNGGGAPSPAPSSTPGPGSDTGGAASPQGQQNPALKAALGQLTSMAQVARQYAQAYPQCAPEMRQVGELLQKCLMKTTQQQQQPEPATPPV